MILSYMLWTAWTRNTTNKVVRVSPAPLFLIPCMFQQSNVVTQVLFCIIGDIDIGSDVSNFDHYSTQAKALDILFSLALMHPCFHVLISVSFSFHDLAFINCQSCTAWLCPCLMPCRGCYGFTWMRHYVQWWNGLTHTQAQAHTQFRTKERTF